MFALEIVALKVHGEISPTAADFPEAITTAFLALFPTGHSRLYAIAGVCSLIRLMKRELALLERCKQEGTVVDYQVVERIETRPSVH